MEVVVGSKLQEVLCPIPRVGSGTLSTDRQSVVLKLVASSCSTACSRSTETVFFVLLVLLINKYNNDTRLLDVEFLKKILLRLHLDNLARPVYAR